MFFVEKKLKNHFQPEPFSMLEKKIPWMQVEIFSVGVQKSWMGIVKGNNWILLSQFYYHNNNWILLSLHLLNFCLSYNLFTIKC